MLESAYHQLVDETLQAIEDAIDTLETDIDCETSGGILTLTFANRSKIIINRQPPIQQLWVAARSGGFHLDYDPTTNLWKTDIPTGKNQAGEDLFKLLSRLCTEQAGETINF